jgi:hypothetical protein
MNLPDDPTLPFFTYGLFRPGQIGYGSIRALVETSEAWWVVQGELLERDGLPLLAEGTNEVQGWLIRFKSESAITAYMTINAIEPDRRYRWDAAEVHC